MRIVVPLQISFSAFCKIGVGCAAAIIQGVIKNIKPTCGGPSKKSGCY